jgi:CBS domain containing-hemolysin-like protein
VSNTSFKSPPAAAAALLMLTVALPAQASGHGGAMADTIANAMSWFVICVIPIAALAAFWMVHVMPEKIAHKNHHPQTKAIQVLCLLSLVFGGLLWPLAWLWAYTKPVSYRAAYGTDKHEDYHLDMARKHREGLLSEDESRHLRDELDTMHAKGALAPELKTLRDELHAGGGAA